MDFNYTPPEWNNGGSPPSEDIKTEGFKAGYKPPASVFNWFWSRVSNCLKELQTNLDLYTQDNDTALAGKVDKTQYASTKQAGIIKLHKRGDGTNISGIVVYDDGTAVINTSDSKGTTRDGAGQINIVKASEDEIAAKSQEYKPIVPKTIDYAVGVANPTYTVPSSLSEVNDNENVSSVFGKVKKAVNELISHLNNNNNPHGVTKEQVGLGKVDNKSSETIRNEITKKNVTDALGYTPPEQDTTYGPATELADGLMTAEDKAIMENLPDRVYMIDEIVFSGYTDEFVSCYNNNRVIAISEMGRRDIEIKSEDFGAYWIITNDTDQPVDVVGGSGDSGDSGYAYKLNEPIQSGDTMLCRITQSLVRSIDGNTPGTIDVLSGSVGNVKNSIDAAQVSVEIKVVPGAYADGKTRYKIWTVSGAWSDGVEIAYDIDETDYYLYGLPVDTVSDIRLVISCDVAKKLTFKLTTDNSGIPVSAQTCIIDLAYIYGRLIVSQQVTKQ